MSTTSKTSTGFALPRSACSPSDVKRELGTCSDDLARRERLPRPRERLEPRGDVHGVADDGVLHARRAPEVAHEDLAGRDADAELDVECVRLAPARQVRRDERVHVLRRGERARDVVVGGPSRVGGRRP